MKYLFDFNGNPIPKLSQVFKIGNPEITFEVTETGSLRSNGQIQFRNDEWEPREFLIATTDQEKDAEANRVAEARIVAMAKNTKKLSPRDKENIRAQKEAFVAALENSVTLNEAIDTSGVTKAKVYYWKKHDPEIAALLDSRRPVISVLKEKFLQNYAQVGVVQDARDVTGVGNSQLNYWLCHDEAFLKRYAEIKEEVREKREKARFERRLEKMADTTAAEETTEETEKPVTEKVEETATGEVKTVTATIEPIKATTEPVKTEPQREESAQPDDLLEVLKQTVIELRKKGWQVTCSISC